MYRLTQKPYKVILFGPQGSGKGTQAHRLSETLGIPTFSMGQLIRDEIASGSELGKRFAPIVAEGKLIVLSTELSIDLALYWHHWNQQSIQLQKITAVMLQHAKDHMC